MLCEPKEPLKRVNVKPVTRKKLRQRNVKNTQENSKMPVRDSF
jgi:hypothetical protein